MVVVSVIVPVYGVEHYIDRCIQSVIAQTYRDWELILVDDGSPDRSGDICDRYAAEDPRIRVIHSENRGVSHARNLGLEVAAGTFITFIDSDDWVAPRYLENLLRFNPDADSVVYGNVINDYTDGKESTESFNYEDGKVIQISKNLGEIIQYFNILENGLPFAKLFQADLIKSNNLTFDETISYHEDHIFVLSYLLCCAEIILSLNADYHYVHRVGSLSKKPHSASKMITASNNLIDVVSRTIDRVGITDKSSQSRLYTMLGLNQLMIALKNAKADELEDVAIAMRTRKDLFRRFYSPNHKVLKIVPILINLHCEKLFKPVLRWREKHI